MHGKRPPKVGLMPQRLESEEQHLTLIIAARKHDPLINDSKLYIAEASSIRILNVSGNMQWREKTTAKTVNVRGAQPAGLQQVIHACMT
jgi:hypothetical protein